MKGAAKQEPTHVTRGNVLDDLGFSPQSATALKFKAQLYQAILKYSRKYSQKELQAILGEPQPRVSELLNGKIAHKSIDKLLYYAGRLGIEAKAKFVQVRNVNRSHIDSNIGHGFRAAEGGPLIDADEVRSRMAERKRATR